MKFVALIPARGGSKRIPRKNLALVGGVSLVERAIRTAKAAGVVDEVWVTTDDHEIAVQSVAAGARCARRDEEDATDSATMERVVAGFLCTHDFESDDCLILLEPTAPLRTPDDIKNIMGVMRYAQAARTVSVDSTGKCHGWVYRDVGLASAIRVGAFDGCLFPQGTVLIHGGDGRDVDVDTLADLERARALA